MRKYFLKPPKWSRYIYPEALWERSDLIDPEASLHITIDDGPHPDSTPEWLALLEKMDVKATFFLVGTQAQSYPSLVQAIKDQGHTIGSHGMYHLDGWKEKNEVYIPQVEESLNVLQCSIFRPPFGRLTRRQYRTLSDKCDIIMWSLMIGDFDKRVSSSVLYKRFAIRKEHDIMVFHDHPDAFKRVEGLFLDQIGDFVL